MTALDSTLASVTAAARTSKSGNDYYCLHARNGNRARWAKRVHARRTGRDWHLPVTASSSCAPNGVNAPRFGHEPRLWVNLQQLSLSAVSGTAFCASVPPHRRFVARGTPLQSRRGQGELAARPRDTLA